MLSYKKEILGHKHDVGHLDQSLRRLFLRTILLGFTKHCHLSCFGRISQYQNQPLDPKKKVTEGKSNVNYILTFLAKHTQHTRKKNIFHCTSASFTQQCLQSFVRKVSLSIVKGTLFMHYYKCIIIINFVANKPVRLQLRQ